MFVQILVILLIFYYLLILDSFDLLEAYIGISCSVNIAGNKSERDK